MLELILTGMFALILGNYAFGWRLYERLSDKISKIESNHMLHLRLHLQARCDDECYWCKEEE